MRAGLAVLAAAITAGLTVLGCTAGVAKAAPVPSFAMVGTAAFTGTATDGTPLSIGVHVDQAELSLISAAGSQTTAPSGSVFLVVEVHSDESAGNGPSFDGFDAVATADLMLRSSSGTVPATVSATPSSGPLTGTYYFAVPPSITSAQIEVGPATVGAVEYPGALGTNGKLTGLTLDPTTIDLVLVKTPATTTPPTSTPAPSHAEHSRVIRSAPGLSLPGQIGIGAGSGGVVLLFVVIPIFIRRRRYDRADRDGRVIIDTPLLLERGPPALPAQGTDHVEEGAPDSDHQASTVTVTVALLGDLEVHGLRRPITSTPVRELLCYLALHPGRSFTTAELRNAIWAEPRTEPSAKTFRNYVWMLRKALPAGTFDPAGYRYRLSDAVVSDWAAFVGHVAVGGESRLSHLRSALGLIRGRPFASPEARDPDAYGWAKVEFSVVMERAIEDTTHEVVTLALADKDLDLADWALSRWPPGPPWSVLLEGDSLRVAAARGAPGGVVRALDATRSHLGEEAVILEDLARELGWVG
jgi:hypothetical protein